MRSRLRIPVHYTGFVRPGGGPSPLRRERRIVVSAGGGRVGEPLLRAAVEAHGQLASDTGVDMTVIGGPFLPEPAWRRLRASARGHEGIELLRSVPDLGRQLRSAAASISQCGYNTAIELIAARVPALVVPYSAPEEDEQTARARRLAALGALRVLEPDRLYPSTLAGAARELLDFRPRATALDLDGALRTAELLAAMVGAPGEPLRRDAGRFAATAEPLQREVSGL